MELKKADLQPEQAEFLVRYFNLGGVLDFCLLEFEATDAGRLEISKEAALAAMKIFAEKRSTQFYQVTVDGAPRGGRISFREFLGSGFDFENERVAMFRYNFGSRSSADSNGLLRALLDPPYSLRLRPETEAERFSPEYGVAEQAAMTAFLFEFLDKVLGVRNLRELSRFEIYEWSDDWSNYFDGGKEWWGTFFWTLLDPEKRTVAVLAASTTD